jgi:hypothetical protein
VGFVLDLSKILVPISGTKSVKSVVQFLNTGCRPRQIQSIMSFFRWMRKYTKTIKGEIKQRHGKELSSNRWMLDPANSSS